MEIGPQSALRDILVASPVVKVYDPLARKVHGDAG
jgi:hypothetical protein